jgi:hypothetical protein
MPTRLINVLAASLLAISLILVAFSTARANDNSGNDTRPGNPALGAAHFAEARFGNLRVDYVLPRQNLSIQDAGVFWPADADPLSRLTGPGVPAVSSDHRLVWVDVKVPGTADRK